MAEDTEEEFAGIARSCLEGFQEIQRLADIDVQKPFAGTQAKITAEILRRQPAATRLVFKRYKKVVELYLCPTAAPVGDVRHTGRPIWENEGPQFASIRTPLARFNAYEIGRKDETTEDFRLIEKEDFYFPYEVDEIPEVTDSKNTRVRRYRKGVVTIPSLRALVESWDRRHKVESQDEDDLGWMFEEPDVVESGDEPLVVAGLKRRERIAFGLQALIVDNEQQYQAVDAAIDSAIVVLGAPGTGKTTAMVQRLLTKTFDSGWSEDDKESVALAVKNGMKTNSGMQNNWRLFVPTDLLGIYVRRALDNQGLGNLEERMSTWADYRRDFARYPLGVLRTHAAPSGFVLLEDGVDRITERAKADPAAWYEAYERFCDRYFIELVVKEVETLVQSENAEVSAFGERLRAIVSTLNPNAVGILCELESQRDVLRSLAASIDAVMADDMTNECKRFTRSIENLHARWNDFVRQEAKEANQARAEARVRAPAGEEFEEDDEFADDETPAEAKHFVAVLTTALKDYARAMVIGREAAPKTKRLFERFKEGWPEHAVLMKLGRRVNELRALKRLDRMFPHFFGSWVRKFRSFREEDLAGENPQWFVKGGKKAEITPPELDIVMLCAIRTRNNLYRNVRIMRRHGEEIRRSLDEQTSMMVFVDEATDFSPVQLAAMYETADPRLRSFTACGDIHQRLTDEGTRTKDDIRWAVPGAEFFELHTAFRQTRALHRIGEALLKLEDGELSSSSEVDKELSELDDVEPILACRTGSLEAQGDWMARNIARMLTRYESNSFPTIAIFTATDEDVEPLAAILRRHPAVRDYNLAVKACLAGQSISSDTKIGVYPVEFVKGLEFEIVFFADIDRLAQREPSRFLRYLYVGATRASRCLAISCREALPSPVEAIESLFGDNWTEGKPG